jgi:hypothetical protein
MLAYMHSIVKTILLNNHPYYEYISIMTTICDSMQQPTMITVSYKPSFFPKMISL